MQITRIQILCENCYYKTIALKVQTYCDRKSHGIFAHSTCTSEPKNGNEIYFKNYTRNIDSN